MKRTISGEAILRRLTNLVRRFPLAVLAVVALVVLAFVSLHGPENAVDPRLWALLPFALYASVAATLALEERLPWWKTLLAGVGVAALWGVRCLFLSDEFNDIPALMVEVAVVNTAAFLSIFFIAFLRRDTDAEWWNFTLWTALRLLMGGFFAGILFGGLTLAFYAVGELFNVTLPDQIFADLAIVCFKLFAPLYVLAGVPSGEAKHDPELHPEPLLKVLGLYILAPILAVYTLILYLYLLKIVVTWELPDGWVSWLVTVLATGGLATALLLYPHRMRGGNRVVEFLGRWTGVVIAPLLALMTVGIVRRISDYGFTPNRCYILLLNLWFYGVYTWLFIVRGRRVKWIVISAVAVALLSSVGPWNLARVAQRENTGEVVEERSEFFASNNTLLSNTPHPLGGEYNRFLQIVWYGQTIELGDSVELTEQEDDLIVRLGREAREFRIPLRQAASSKEIRGEDFLFIVGQCQGRNYEAQDSIHISHLEGYLFYK